MFIGSLWQVKVDDYRGAELASGTIILKKATDVMKFAATGEEPPIHLR